VHIAIDEDHCYAFKPGRVKAEYWPEYDLYNTATTTFTATQEEEDNTYTALKGSPPQDLGSEEAIQAIQSCPVIMEEDLNYQEADYTKDTVKAGTEYVKEYVIEQEGNIHQQVNLEQEQEVQEQHVQEEEEVEQKEAPEYTTIVYQDKVGAEQFYTETIVTDVMAAEEYYSGGNNVSYGNAGNNSAMQQVAAEVEKPAVRIKNKRTVAAVSSEDKRRALNAMEELRARGATTDDLMCRLCDPARPFTAYSTLLTHYRSHAGLRPFECSLCGATFTRQHSLNYHLMTHANQTRFTCPHCNRKFRHPTHFKEHVKKHGEVVQFLCNFCPASLSTQSQYRKHLKMRHNKTIDIMGNIIDSPPEAKDKDRAKRKRRVLKSEDETSGVLGKRKRRRRLKTDSTEISQYEEVVHSSSNQNQNSGSVIYEETVPMSESEQMYQTSEYLEPKEGLEMFDPHQGQYVEQVALQYETEPQYVEQYVVATNDNEAKIGESRAEVVQQPKSPMIFVVPNSGQKPQVKRKPLLINTTGEQKKQVVISKVQSNVNGGKVGGGESRMKQGVIAQINGQKVLLVPKKKSEGSGGDQHRVLVMSQGSTVSTGQQQQQQQNVSMTWNGQSTLALALSTQSGVVQQHRVVSQVRKSTTGTLQSTVRLAAASANQPQVNSSGVVAVTTRVYPEAKQSCLTEIDPNTVQNNADTVPDNNKINILEQAMHEVFPSEIDFGDASPEEALTEISPQVVDDLYNPMRSPLKNRNKILCEVLGIDS